MNRGDELFVAMFYLIRDSSANKANKQTKETYPVLNIPEDPNMRSTAGTFCL